MGITLLIIIATVAYALFQFFSAKAGGKLDGSLAPLVMNVVNIALLLLFFLSQLLGKAHLLPTQRSGLIYAGWAGVAIAVFILSFNKIFQHGGNLSFVSPMIFGAAIVLSTILSVLFLKESLTPYHFLGIVLVISGIAFISFARSV